MSYGANIKKIRRILNTTKRQHFCDFHKKDLPFAFKGLFKRLPRFYHTNHGRQIGNTNWNFYDEVGNIILLFSSTQNVKNDPHSSVVSIDSQIDDSTLDCLHYL